MAIFEIKEGNGPRVESTIWRGVLSEEERAALAAGISPLLVRPQDIVYHSSNIIKYEYQYRRCRGFISQDKDFEL